MTSHRRPARPSISLYLSLSLLHVPLILSFCFFPLSYAKNMYKYIFYFFLISIIFLFFALYCCCSSANFPNGSSMKAFCSILFSFLLVHQASRASVSCRHATKSGDAGGPGGSGGPRPGARQGTAGEQFRRYFPVAPRSCALSLVDPVRSSAAALLTLTQRTFKRKTP